MSIVVASVSDPEPNPSPVTNIRIRIRPGPDPQHWYIVHRWTFVMPLKKKFLSKPKVRFNNGGFTHRSLFLNNSIKSKQASKVGKTKASVQICRKML
jgi:hypothetical protein